MKRFIAFLIFLVSLFGNDTLIVEGTMGYFRPSQRIFREVYQSAWLNLGLSAEYRPVSFSGRRSLALFTAVNYLSSKGSSEGLEEATSIYAVPLSFGLKWVQPVTNSLSCFVGAGPRYYLGEITNHSPFVRNENFFHGFGVFSRFGVRYQPTCHLVLDLYVGYAINTLNTSEPGERVESYTLHLDGLELSGGIGWAF